MTFIDPAAYDHAAKQQNEMLDALHAELNHRVAQVQELQSKLPSWVNAAERLPENTALVLTWVVDDEDGYARAYVMHHHKTYGWTSWFPMTHARVTHWMPLPEPPK